MIYDGVCWPLKCLCDFSSSKFDGIHVFVVVIEYFFSCSFNKHGKILILVNFDWKEPHWRWNRTKKLCVICLFAYSKCAAKEWKENDWEERKKQRV